MVAQVFSLAQCQPRKVDVLRVVSNTDIDQKIHVTTVGIKPTLGLRHLP